MFQTGVRVSNRFWVKSLHASVFGKVRRLFGKIKTAFGDSNPLQTTQGDPGGRVWCRVLIGTSALHSVYTHVPSVPSERAGLMSPCFYPGLCFYAYIKSSNPDNPRGPHTTVPEPHQLTHQPQKLNTKPQLQNPIYSAKYRSHCAIYKTNYHLSLLI